MSNKESALLSIDNNKELFIDLSDDIWEHPETGFHEYFAMENYCRILEEHGGNSNCFFGIVWIRKACNRHPWRI